MRNRNRVLSMALTLATMSACGAAPPEATAEAFYRHVGAGEVDAAIDLLSGPIVAMAGEGKLRAGMTQMASEIEQKGGFASIEAQRKEGGADAEAVVVNVSVIYGDGTSESSDLTLVMEEGAWKIQMEK